MSDSGTMQPPDAHEPADLLRMALPVSQKVVLVIDLVESVRLMAADEAGTVARWRDFANTAQNHTIPAHHGRLVKSLGDGLMVEFENPRDAANTAHTLHAVMQKGNAGQSAERQMHLRAGINATHVYTDHNDIYGAGVNLAARIATLAGPGETVITAQVRDGLTDGLDATIEDLGECYLKHIDEPVRAYRVGAAGQAPVVLTRTEYATAMYPTIAVIPFASRTAEPLAIAVGDLIADRVIGHLSRTAELKVISRLSTRTFRDRVDPLNEVKAHFGANYTLTGGYVAFMDRLTVSAELTDCATHEVLWSRRLTSSVNDLVGEESDLCQTIASSVHRMVVHSEVQTALTHPLPTLPSATLLLGAINMMHRHSRREQTTAKQMLDYLLQRHSRNALAHAWVANWHAMQVTQGRSEQIEVDLKFAIEHSKRALDANPNCSLALAIDGVLQVNLQKDLTLAAVRFDLALEVNPNEGLAWISKGIMHGFQGEGVSASRASAMALSLSPLDPIRHYYNSLAATAELGALNYAKAIELGEHSYRVDQMHPSTFRTLIMAHQLGGDKTRAHLLAGKLLEILPTYTVNDFKKHSGHSIGPNALRFSEALIQAGIPR